MSATRLQQLLAFHHANPQDSFILFALAKEHEKLGEDAIALTYYLRLLEGNTEYVGAYYHLGKLYERAGDPSNAFLTYKKGMEVAKQAGDRHALGELAEANLSLGYDED